MGVKNEKTRRRRFVRLPSPSMAVALLALFIALTSGAYATAKFKHGPKGIVNRQDIAVNSIGSPEVIDHSLMPVDLNSSALKRLKGLRGAPGPAGPQGPAGVNGAKGDKGDAGPPGAAAYEVVLGTTRTVQPGAANEDSGYTACPSGKVPLGGGPFVDKFPSSSMRVVESFPASDSGSDGWSVSIINEGSTAETYHVDVVCAKVSTTKALSSSVERAR